MDNWKNKIFLLLLLGITFYGCANQRYYHTHKLEELNIVFTDLETINQLYVELSPLNNKPVNRYVAGFFDPNTNTIYVEKENFETLGHEVSHAIQSPYNFHLDN